MSHLRRTTAAVAALAALAGALALATPASASATAPQGGQTTWSVVPAGTQGADGRQAFAYDVKPGSLIQDEVAVANRGATAETFHFYATDAFTDRSTGAFSLLVASKKPTDIGAWVTMSLQSRVIGPGQELRIPFQLAVPSNASPGDHTAGIIASVIVDAKDKSKAAIKVEERVAARVYLHVDGAVTAKASSEAQSSGYAVNLNPFAPGTASVDYTVKNTGNVRVDVAPHIAVTGPFGIPIASFDGPTIRNLLPGDSVRQEQHADAWPLVLLWTTVRLKTLAPTDTVAAGDVRDLTGAVVAQQAPASYTSSTADTIGAAIPFALLLIVAAIIGIGWLLVRYVQGSRERVWAALEEAAREREAHESIPPAERERQP